MEYNARFGDPECQVLMLRLESDIVPYLHAAATGALAELPPPDWRDEAAICVVLAADGYPDAPQKGSVISGAEADFGPDVVVFHAGTARGPDGRADRRGRAGAERLRPRRDAWSEARERAYAAVARIDWPEGFHRTDIGWRALK